jgi:hypothetical protein
MRFLPDRARRVWLMMFPRYETVNLPPFESPMDFSYMSEPKRGESKLATKPVDEIVDDFSAHQEDVVDQIIRDLDTGNKRRFRDRYL